jgi:hypothetical protein
LNPYGPHGPPRFELGASTVPPHQHEISIKLLVAPLGLEPRRLLQRGCLGSLRLPFHHEAKLVRATRLELVKARSLSPFAVPFACHARIFLHTLPSKDSNLPRPPWEPCGISYHTVPRRYPPFTPLVRMCKICIQFSKSVHKTCPFHHRGEFGQNCKQQKGPDRFLGRALHFCSI